MVLISNATCGTVGLKNKNGGSTIISQKSECSKDLFAFQQIQKMQGKRGRAVRFAPGEGKSTLEFLPHFRELKMPSGGGIATAEMASFGLLCSS